MSICIFRRGLLFLFASLSLLSSPVFSGSPLEVMVEPAYSVTWRASDRWSFTSQLKMRQLVGGNELSGFEATETDRFEFQIFGNYTIMGSRRIGLGYVYRLLSPFEDDPENYHRIVQQYATTYNIENSRLALRLRSEQRFRGDEFSQRFRIRAGAEIPLKGVRLEVWDPYLLFQNELLFETGGGESAWDNRVDGGIGWLLPNRMRFQVQLQHRFEEFNLDSKSHTIKVMTTFLMSF
ncbi:MAG TPA: DUF2490 domain-containing protein [Bacteroidales bacterium]|nr:DUF2490 domain-containing protein [Bacteroidales bacterium]